jgi:hypothetical protein
VVVAALLALLVPAASAQEIHDAADLAAYCGHHPADAEGNMPAALSLVLCYGFLKGVGDTHALLAWGDDGRPRFCLPGGNLSNEESRLLFTDWARRHSEALDQAAAGAVTAALSEAFPCNE